VKKRGSQVEKSNFSHLNRGRSSCSAKKARTQLPQSRLEREKVEGQEIKGKGIRTETRSLDAGKRPKRLISRRNTPESAKKQMRSSRHKKKEARWEDAAPCATSAGKRALPGREGFELSTDQKFGRKGAKGEKSAKNKNKSKPVVQGGGGPKKAPTQERNERRPQPRRATGKVRVGKAGLIISPKETLKEKTQTALQSCGKEKVSGISTVPSAGGRRKGKKGRKVKSHFPLKRKAQCPEGFEKEGKELTKRISGHLQEERGKA